MYVSDANAPCGRISGPNRETMLTREYALALIAAR
jgi:hypothetical protein